MKHKIGIVGCGGIAHQKHFPALNNVKDRVEVIALCDIIPERAEKAVQEVGEPDAKVYTDYHDLISNPDVEIVYVLTPNVVHCEISVAALEAGKHVLCEKPMAASADEARQMAAAAKRNGKLLQIGFVRRYGNDCDIVRDFIQNGSLGDIYYAKATYLRRNGNPGGWFGDKSRSAGGDRKSVV